MDKYIKECQVDVVVTENELELLCQNEKKEGENLSEILRENNSMSANDLVKFPFLVVLAYLSGSNFFLFGNHRTTQGNNTLSS